MDRVEFEYRKGTSKMDTGSQCSKKATSLTVV